jgi:hypothetical protein
MKLIFIVFLLVTLSQVVKAVTSVERFLSQPLDHFDRQNRVRWTMVRNLTLETYQISYRISFFSLALLRQRGPLS